MLYICFSLTNSGNELKHKKMKSKIVFDIDNENHPLIRVKVSYSQEDIRDKVVQRFFDSTLNENGEGLTAVKIIGHNMSQTEEGSYDVQIYPAVPKKAV